MSREPRRGEVRAILTYHSLDRSGSVVSVEPEVFVRHIDWLCARGISVVPLERLLEVGEGVDAVALTFDDAFANFETEAWPVLGERELDVTLYVATDHVGRVNGWEDGGRIPLRPLLDWAALRRLAAEGVALGAHGSTHRALPGLEEVELEREVREPAERIEAETGVRPRTFAYPYGAWDARSARAVAATYDLACTTELRVLRAAEDRHALPRLDMWYFRRKGRLEAWGTRSFRRYVLLRNRLRSARRLISKGNGF